MKIRWKVSALIASLFLVLGVTEIYVADNVLMPSFTELERTEADVSMRRIGYALNRTFEQLQQSVTGWGNWTDSYRFSKDHNRAFVAENITVIGLKQLDINALMILDLKGRMIASGSLDLQSGRPPDLELLHRQVFDPASAWHDNLTNGQPAHGFLQTDRGVLLLATAPILDGFGRGPTRGLVLMGRFLSAAEISQIAAQAQVKLSMLPPGAGPKERLVETDDVTQVYQTFDDIFGKPALTLRVDVPREVMRRGYSAVRYASAYLIGAAVMIVILLVIILNRVVLGPLAQVTRHAVAIGKDKDLTDRLDFKRNDEIGVLAREFDRMVARVAESRGRLIDQSFQQGFDELAKGVLHNLGNAMTPIGVRLASLQTRLRSVPVADFELAAAELVSGAGDAARRADLEEFVRLACGQLESTLQGAEQDLEVISRQTSLVQSALSEQLRSTHNEHVMESVRLPDLLAQSLDVVPDSARDQIEVRADASLSEVGVVNVPRTVLRLVLQNFIINAADSVRERGKVRGYIDITAELAAGEAEALVLHCRDDGVGIPAENLERIFDKGFSTKSRETNFGIGLHWCANAIGALGGRVWATSDGVGRGASLHVMVPLKGRDSVTITRAA